MQLTYNLPFFFLIQILASPIRQHTNTLTKINKTFKKRKKKKAGIKVRKGKLDCNVFLSIILCRPTKAFPLTLIASEEMTFRLQVTVKM